MDKKVVLIVVFLLGLVGCGKNMPKPEAKVILKPVQVVNMSNEIAVFHTQNEDRLFVHYFVRGKDLFVECMVPDISFRDQKDVHKPKGKIRLYVDGQFKEDITSAAFIIKGLNKGSHKIRLQVISNNNKPYHLEKLLDVDIP